LDQALALLDFVMERRERYPDMHIYHYAAYEKTALQKLSLRHATRDNEVDLLLREERLVDLYTVVRQAIVVGQPSYSTKKIEDYYGKRASDSPVQAGDDSISHFEKWLSLRADRALRDDAILDDLERYNKYDCISTYGLREWLLALRDRAVTEFSVEIPFYAVKDVEDVPIDEKFPELKAALDERIPDDFDSVVLGAYVDAVRPYFLARHMLEYHWREKKPILWQFYDRIDTYREDPDLLLDDAECIVGLTQVGAPTKVKLSFDHHFRNPAQLQKLDGGECFDLKSRDKTGIIAKIDDGEDGGTLVLRRGPTRDSPRHSSTMVPAAAIVPRTMC
jgi:uncharacterized protein